MAAAAGWSMMSKCHRQALQAQPRYCVTPLLYCSLALGLRSGWEVCVPCVSCAFLSPLLKFFHQLARSLFCSTLSFWAGGAGLGPPPPACAVDGPPLAMVDGDVFLLPTAPANPFSRTASAPAPSKVQGRQCRRVEDESDALRASRNAHGREAG